MHCRPLQLHLPSAFHRVDVQVPASNVHRQRRTAADIVARRPRRRPTCPIERRDWRAASSFILAVLVDKRTLTSLLLCRSSTRVIFGIAAGRSAGAVVDAVPERLDIDAFSPSLMDTSVIAAMGAVLAGISCESKRPVHRPALSGIIFPRLRHSVDQKHVNFRSIAIFGLPCASATPPGRGGDRQYPVVRLTSRRAPAGRFSRPRHRAQLSFLSQESRVHETAAWLIPICKIRMPRI